MKDKLPPIKARDIDLELAQLALEDSVKTERISPGLTSNGNQNIDQNDGEESSYQEALIDEVPATENPVFLTQVNIHITIAVFTLRLGKL